MTANQRRIVLALTIAVALTRWWAMSASIWDWDEALFSMGVRSFDVAAHNPHPPGFPIFILLAKIINLAVGDEFRALQVINFVGACFLFPAVFYFALELGFSFAVSISGALLTVFAPNVWFFGGTAFSDVPSLTLAVGACALILRSRHAGTKSLYLGALLLGVAAGFRSQNLAIGFFPFVLAAWPRIRTRQWTPVFVAGLIIGAIVVASYVGAGLASYSWENYRYILRDHREYIMKVDSWRNPDRPSLLSLFDDFFIREFQFFKAGIVIFGFAVVSLVDAVVRRRKPPLFLLATFGPFALPAWLILDIASTSRFSIGYLPLFAILAADGIGSVVRFLRFPVPWREGLTGAGGALIALALIVWAAPAITEAHRSLSPSAAAIGWIRKNLSPKTSTVYVARAMVPMSEYELPEYRKIRVQDERGIALHPQEAEDAYLFAEGATMEPSGINFLRSRHSRLWRIARPRYFEVSIVPLARRAHFGEGWHESENEGIETWRWMGRRSVTVLPPQLPPAELRMTFGVPLDAIPPPNVTITLNDRELARIRVTELRHKLAFAIADSRSDGPNSLVIETDQWVNPKERGISDDPRELALRLEDISWGPSRPREKPIR